MIQLNLLGTFTHLPWISKTDIRIGRFVFYLTVGVGSFYIYFEPSFAHESVRQFNNYLKDWTLPSSSNWSPCNKFFLIFFLLEFGKWINC